MIIHAIDTETTGLGDNEEVIELAIVRWDDGERKELYNQRFFPLGLCDLRAAKINGYTEDGYRGNPRFGYNQAEEVAAILGDVKVWLGSNPVFDQGKLKEMFRRTRTPWPEKRIFLRDTASLAMGLEILGLVQTASLGRLLEFFKLDTQKHNALSDCHQSLDVLEKLLEAQMTGYAQL